MGPLLVKHRGLILPGGKGPNGEVIRVLNIHQLRDNKDRNRGNNQLTLILALSDAKWAALRVIVPS